MTCWTKIKPYQTAKDRIGTLLCLYDIGRFDHISVNHRTLVNKSSYNVRTNHNNSDDFYSKICLTRLRFYYMKIWAIKGTCHFELLIVNVCLTFIKYNVPIVQRFCIYTNLCRYNKANQQHEQRAHAFYLLLLSFKIIYQQTVLSSIFSFISSFVRSFTHVYISKSTYNNYILTETVKSVPPINTSPATAVQN